MKGVHAKDIDEYIEGFPAEIQKLLKTMRATIQKAAPKAEEAIRYAMPTFRMNDSNLVHFAAFKNHIGFYPAPHALESFKKELSKYKGSKGAVQFPLDQPLPLSLITKMVKFRIMQNKETVKAKELMGKVKKKKSGK